MAYAETHCLTWPLLTVQIKRLCLSLPEQAPEGAALEAFLAHPDHVLARVSRDISQPDVAVSSLEKPMQVKLTALCPQCTGLATELGNDSQSLRIRLVAR